MLKENRKKEKLEHNKEDDKYTGYPAILIDTLKEIADALGDPDNIAGNVVNKLINHDSQLLFLQGGKNITDVSVNMLHQQQPIYCWELNLKVYKSLPLALLCLLDC